MTVNHVVYKRVSFADQAIHGQKVGKYSTKLSAKELKVSSNQAWRLDSPAGYCLVALLMMGVCVQVVVAANQQPPTTARCSGGSCSLSQRSLSCESAAVKVGGQQQQYLLLPFERHFSHPGVYALPTGVRTQEELTRRRVKDYNSVKDKELYTPAEWFERWKKLYQAYPIDGEVSNNIPVDRTSHELAIQYLEREVLPTPIIKLKTKDLIGKLLKFNAILNNEPQGIIRNKPVLVRRVPAAVPAFFDLEKISKYFEDKPVEEMQGYATLLQKVASSCISREQIKEKARWEIVIHDTLQNDPDSSLAQFVSRYYLLNTLNKAKIEQKLQKLINDVKFVSRKDPIRAAAMAHQGIVEIHPFKEGNGRTARALMNLVLRQAGYPGVAIYRDVAYTMAVGEGTERFEEYLRELICQTTNLRSSPGFQEGEPFQAVVANCEEKKCQSDFDDVVQRFKL